jgi:hypothetical protein
MENNWWSNREAKSIIEIYEKGKVYGKVVDILVVKKDVKNCVGEDKNKAIWVWC